MSQFAIPGLVLCSGRLDTWGELDRIGRTYFLRFHMCIDRGVAQLTAEGDRVLPGYSGKHGEPRIARGHHHPVVQK